MAFPNSACLRKRHRKGSGGFCKAYKSIGEKCVCGPSDFGVCGQAGVFAERCVGLKVALADGSPLGGAHAGTDL